MKNAPAIERQYRLGLGCLVDAKVRGNVITSKWQMFTMASAGFVRPETGQTSIKVECPRCRRTLCVTVESVRKARQKQRVYRRVGALLLWSLVVWLPMLFHYGAKPVDEGKPEQSPSMLLMGGLLAAVFASFVAGLALFWLGGVYDGVRKLRWVRPDGSLSVLVKGHKV
ncbi:hypothetical protein ABT052_47115 [Streptomyces sp. NPDC002766]|uniref:hypothetical protein n=1 Tax=unclassified Streptomyces TaxID=2593676 RepID=UPI00332915EA